MGKGASLFLHAAQSLSKKINHHLKKTLLTELMEYWNTQE